MLHVSMPVGSLLATDASALQHNAVHQPCIYPTASCRVSALHQPCISPASALHQPTESCNAAVLHQPYSIMQCIMQCIMQSISPASALQLPFPASTLHQPTESCNASALQQPYMMQCTSSASALQIHAVHETWLLLDCSGHDVESAVNDRIRCELPHQSDCRRCACKMPPTQ